MKSVIIRVTALAVGLSAAVNMHGADQAVELFNPVQASKISVCKLNDSAIKVVDSANGRALEIHFGHKQSWPNICFYPEKLKYTKDWSGFRYLAITLSSSGEEPFPVGLRVDSTADRKRGRQASLTLFPGKTIRWLMPICADGDIKGMQGQPPLISNGESDVIADAWSVPLNLKAITRLQLFMSKPTEDHILRVHKIELIKSDRKQTDSFVDRYGQFNGADWPGKIYSDQELHSNIQKEAEYTKANGMLAHYSQYGGWKAGKKQDATGRFQIKKVNGKWWFIDPDGYLFWSSGITGVRIGGNATTVTGREFCFSWLPEKDDPLKRFLTGKGRWSKFDFFSANLFRKYGENFEEAFYNQSTLRLKAWGMNTIANWSDGKAYKLRKLPYMLSIQAKVPRFAVSSFLKAGLTKKKYFPDPFNPDYGPAIIKRFKEMDGYIGDPWMLGVFVDNELPWTARAPSGEGPWVRISVNAFCVNGPDSFIKKALVEQLRKSNKTPADLNNVWKTEYKSWDAVLDPIVLTTEQIKSAEKDMLALEVFIAERYFKETRDAIKKCDPQILYMGPRFSGRYTPEVVAVAAKYCDVMSFNIYEYLPDMRTVDELALEHDFPVIIGEFHFGALDRGMFHTGLRKADNQEDRAQKYVNYIEAGAKASWCVGAHWFQYKDQSLTGRGDGENYNIGFINETDSIYPELSKAARKMHSGLYQLRYSE
ncbi:MAG: hypothetical protein PF904_13435 [Kiritimatiellae bacterium]|jgi:hypothetical protein|nr:hypothetical protein [Kiritimatiellia bacterium]